jgi:hypothetical protein
MGTSLVQLVSCLRFVGGSLRTNDKEEVLVSKANTVSRVQELTVPFGAVFLRPNTELDMLFLASDEMISQCQKHGQVLASGAPDPSKCHATGKGTEVAVVGQRAMVTVQAVNFKDRACEELVTSFACHIVFSPEQVAL